VADRRVLRRTRYRHYGRPTHTLCYNPTMDEQSLAKQLREEGFSHTYIWQDGPGAHYPDHTHPGQTAHIILTGEMTLTTAGRSQTYRSGDRCDVPANAVHSAHMGPKGCRYLIGER
jgi:mannose-6-phosphate isomerase-like protein (cupin superfamily)